MIASLVIGEPTVKRRSSCGDHVFSVALKMV